MLLFFFLSDSTAPAVGKKPQPPPPIGKKPGIAAKTEPPKPAVAKSTSKDNNTDERTNSEGRVTLLQFS